MNGSPEHGSAVAPRRRRIARLVFAAVALGVMGTAGVAGYGIWAMGGSGEGRPVQVVVDEGETGATIAAQLAEKDVIRSAFVFRLIARVRGVGSDLKPGAYEMRTGLGINGAIEQLLEGVPQETIRFTVPEGRTVIEIARIVDRDTHVSEREFLRAVRSGDHRIQIMPKGVSDLEGLLFPKTYEVTVEDAADDLVELMLAQFEKEVSPLNLRKAERLGITPYEAVIVASLIEREAKVQVDRPKIASVIYNRLARPMRLQIDATVQYAILLQTGSYKDPLTRDDYTAVDSPYNTYQIDGLPPGPIASPGLPSLRGALNPADTDFFFYRARAGETAHCFSRDEAGHAACGRGG